MNQNLDTAFFNMSNNNASDPQNTLELYRRSALISGPVNQNLDTAFLDGTSPSQPESNSPDDRQHKLTVGDYYLVTPVGFLGGMLCSLKICIFTLVLVSLCYKYHRD